MDKSQLIEEIAETYEEWLEMGHPLDELLLALLHKEREKNEHLHFKIDQIRRERSQV
jgi:hypothetical protein